MNQSSQMFKLIKPQGHLIDQLQNRAGQTNKLIIEKESMFVFFGI